MVHLRPTGPSLPSTIYNNFLSLSGLKTSLWPNHSHSHLCTSGRFPLMVPLTSVDSSSPPWGYLLLSSTSPLHWDHPVLNLTHSKHTGVFPVQHTYWESFIQVLRVFTFIWELWKIWMTHVSSMLWNIMQLLKWMHKAHVLIWRGSLKKKDLPDGCDSSPPMQGAQDQSLVRELDLACCKLKNLCVATKTWYSQFF